MNKSTLWAAALASCSALMLAPAVHASECFNSNVSGDNTEAAPSGRSSPGESASQHGAQVRKAKLQIGNGSDTCYSESEISNSDAQNDHFWLSKSETFIYFEESGNKHRSELREEREFEVDDSGSNYVRTKAKIIKKADGLKEVTIAQVHAENTSGPLARLAWADAGVHTDVDGNSPEGMWLALRQSGSCSSSSSSCFSHSYLGNIDGSYKTYRLGIWDGDLRLKVYNTYVNIVREDIFDDDNDGNYSEKKTSDSIDLTGTEWDGEKLYLKVGAYLNSSGKARVGHTNLWFF